MHVITRRQLLVDEDIYSFRCKPYCDVVRATNSTWIYPFFIASQMSKQGQVHVKTRCRVAYRHHDASNGL